MFALVDDVSFLSFAEWPDNVTPIGPTRGKDDTTMCVLSRYLVAKRTGERALPDALAQPVSIAVAASLLLASLQRHRAGTLTWRGRPLP